jgi:hypothetical protein
MPFLKKYHTHAVTSEIDTDDDGLQNKHHTYRLRLTYTQIAITRDK